MIFIGANVTKNDPKRWSHFICGFGRKTVQKWPQFALVNYYSLPRFISSNQRFTKTVERNFQHYRRVPPKQGSLWLGFEFQWLTEIKTTWWFQICFIFTPTWGRFPIWLYNIFQRGWKQPTSYKLSVPNIGHGCKEFLKGKLMIHSDYATRNTDLTPELVDAIHSSTWTPGKILSLKQTSFPNKTTKKPTILCFFWEWVDPLKNPPKTPRFCAIFAQLTFANSEVRFADELQCTWRNSSTKSSFQSSQRSGDLEGPSFCLEVN